MIEFINKANPRAWDPPAFKKDRKGRHDGREEETPRGQADYMPEAEIAKGLEEQTIFEGIVNMNFNSCFNGKIITNEFTCSPAVRQSTLNRAMDGCVVYFKIVSPPNWPSFLKFRTPNSKATAIVIQEEKKEPEENEEAARGNSDDNLEHEEEVQERLRAEVVGIKRSPFVGEDKTRILVKVSTGDWKKANEFRHFTARPCMNKKLPWFNLEDYPFRNTKNEYIAKNLKSFSNETVFIGEFDSWAVRDRHPKMTLVGVLETNVKPGSGDPMPFIKRDEKYDKEIEKEMLASLITHGVFVEGFSKETLAEVKAKLRVGPDEKEYFDIPEEEMKVRADFRDKLVYSIDPITACDIDDALSIKKTGENEFEVGVHIADPSYFCTPDSSLEKDVLKRATSVYCQYKFYPMLPSVLTANLCSLWAGADKMAFSVVFRMDGEGTIVGDPLITKSIIHSKGKLS
jgi:exoribonuclease R